MDEKKLTESHVKQLLLYAPDHKEVEGEKIYYFLKTNRLCCIQHILRYFLISFYNIILFNYFLYNFLFFITNLMCKLTN